MMLESSPLEPHIETSPSGTVRQLSPSPRSPHSHPVDEQLKYSLSDLHLCTQQQESRSLMQRGGTPTHAKGCPPSLQTPVAECPPLAPVQKKV